MLINNLNVTVNLNAATQREMVKNLAFLNSLPDKCGFPGCGSDIYFNHRITKTGGHEYFELLCRNPEQYHQCNIGQNKNEDQTMFCKNEWKVAEFKDNVVAAREAEVNNPRYAEHKNAPNQLHTNNTGAMNSVLRETVERNAKEKGIDPRPLAKSMFEAELDELTDPQGKTLLKEISALEPAGA